MKLNGKEVLVCNCEGTMTIDGKALAKACQGGDKKGGKTAKKVEELNVASHLCRTQIEEFQRLAGQGSELLVACTQEAPLFLETLEEMGEDAPAAQFLNIREKAGWSKDATEKSPQKTDITAKMAALLTEAALDLEAATTVTMISGGVLLVMGTDDRALEAAKKVASRLGITSEDVIAYTYDRPATIDDCDPGWP